MLNKTIKILASLWNIYNWDTKNSFRVRGIEGQNEIPVIQLTVIW